MRSSATRNLIALFGVLCIGQAAPPPPAELSTIVIPIRTTLAPLLPILEKQVPRSMSKLDAYEFDPQKRYGAKYDVARQPIALNMIGSGIHATLTVKYALEGCKRVVNPINGAYSMWPCVSCGFNEKMREAYIAIDSHLEWDAAWRMRTKTTARPVEFPNRCQVTFANLDITDRAIAPKVNEQLRDVAKTIDANTPKLTNIRPNAQQIWDAFQTPTEIAPRTFLILDPIDVALGPIRGAGLNVTSAIMLRARTRVVLGDRPIVTAKPLPPLRVAAANETSGSIRVPADVDLPYAEASRVLTEQLGKRTYKVGGRDLILDTLALSPAANGKLTIAAAIDYRGGTFRNYRGVVYLEGTPRFRDGMIVIENVDYSIDPKRRNPFLRIGDRIAHDTVKTQIAANSSWPIAGQIAALRNELQRALTRQLAPGVTLRGNVDSFEATELLPLLDSLRIRMLATGSAEVEVTKW
ncbi:MAG: hypothetical protein JWO97_633 [Acidobacteria bacterium]|nr:hypothetical protein [Acidobacteriota bacterium]